MKAQILLNKLLRAEDRDRGALPHVIQTRLKLVTVLIRSLQTRVELATVLNHSQ